jgi:hypothetical protein
MRLKLGWLMLGSMRRWAARTDHPGVPLTDEEGAYAMRALKMTYMLALAVSALLGGAVVNADCAFAEETAKMQLFKLVTAKDEVLIGVSGDELRSFGGGTDLDNLAQRLAAAGEMSVWQYAVKKASDGALVQAPLRKIAIFRSEAVRVEPYNPAPLRVMAPDSP